MTRVARGDLDPLEAGDELRERLVRQRPEAGVDAEEVPESARPRQCLERRPDLRMPACEGGEDARVQAQDPHLAARPHRGVTGGVLEQAGLAERIAALENVQRHLLTVGGQLQHTGGAERQHEERVGRVALLDNRRAERELELVEALGDEAADALVEEGECRHCREELVGLEGDGLRGAHATPRDPRSPA